MVDFIKKKSRLLLIIVFIAIVFIAGSFAWIRIGYNGNSINKIKAGTLDLTLDDTMSNGIVLEKAVPISYQQGITTTEYTFKLKNTGNYTVGYTLFLENVDSFIDENNETVTITDDNRMADRFLRYILVKNGEEKSPEKSKLLSETTNRVLDTGVLAATEENTYILQIWIDSKAGDNNEQDLVMNKYFNAVLKLDAIQAEGSGNGKKYALVLNGNGGSSTTIFRDTNEQVGELPESTREGYTFDGWYTLAEGGEEVTEQTPIKSEKETYYAHWTINQYTVSFDGNGGTDGESITDYYNSELGSLPTSQRVGYTFDGWYTSAEDGEEITENSTIPGRNTTYYAHWVAKQYTISFDGNGGTDGETITKNYGTKLGDLPDSTRYRYVFDGWYTQREGGEKITENTPVPAENTTYYAHWNENFHNVIYDYEENGGDSTTAEDTTVVRDEDIDLDNRYTATKSGYEFVGWNTNKDATSKLTSLKMGTEDVILYAIFRKQVTANFDGNGATLSSNSVSCYVYNKLTSCTSDSEAPTITRANYEIKGYATTASATDAAVGAPTQGTTFTIGLNGATYYAITSKNLSSTAYYYDGANQATTSLGCTIYNEETVCTYALPQTITESNGPDGTEYKGLSTTKESATTAESITSANAKYYTVYEKTINVTFYYNDNGVTTATSSGIRTATTDETSYTTEYGTVVVPSEVIASKGPNNNADYSGISKDKNSQTGITATSQYTKYYAYYNGTWAVDYNREEATVASIGKSRDTCDNYASTDELVYTTTGISCEITLPEITAQTGYTKDGWYEGVTKVGVELESYTITKSTTLIAKATINSYTVTYDATENGGTTAATTDTVDYNASIDLTPNAEKAEYDFLGWNTNKNATSGLGSLTMGTSNVTLYAIFKKSTTISLEGKTTEYTGSAIDANEAVVSDGSATPDVTYTYYTDDQCTTKVATTTGATIAGGAPIDVGNYYAQASVAAVTGADASTSYKSAKSNCVTHNITAKDITLTWGGITFDYTGSPQAPTVEVSSVISGETLSVTNTSATNAGNHTSEATLSVTGGRAKASNYNVTNPTQSYTINTVANTLELSADKTVAYGTTSTTFTVNTNVSGGDLSVVADNNATATISSSTVTVSDIENLTAGTVVKVTVTSAATTNYRSAEQIYNLTIGQQTVNPVTNLSVSTAGIVTWTASSNATGYEISFDGTTYTTATNGGNYLSQIITSTGEKTVSVRAINSDTTNYATPSNAVDETVNVVTFTTQSNNPSYGTVDSSTYNVISGVTFEANTNTLLVKSGATTLKTITATKTDATGYTTNFSSWSPSSGTVSSNTIVTANFTRTVNSYTVTYDSQNLLYGLEDTDGWDTTNSRMKYSISNGVVTVHSLQSDGYGNTPGRVYLEANHTYVLSANSNGNWGSAEDEDTVQVCLVYETGSPVYHKSADSDLVFTPTTTGTYTLRLDVNQNDTEHTFSNITVKEKIADSDVDYGTSVDLSKTVTKDDYTFLGWNTNKDATSGLNSLTMPAEDVTLYAIYTKNVVVTFNKNGATSQTVSGGSASTAGTVTQSCTLYNNDLGCNITSPTITASSNTPTVIGYSLSASDHTSSWNVNTVKKVGVSKTLYAQTKANEQTLSVDFSRNTTEIASINNGTTRISCTVGESYNGVAQATSCNASAVTPSMTANEGFVAVGFFTSNTGEVTQTIDESTEQATATYLDNVSTSYLAAGTSFTITASTTNISSNQVATGTTLYARGRYVIASEVGYSNTNTGLKDSSGTACTDTKCALDAMTRILQ